MIGLKPMLSIVALLKNLALTDLKCVEKRFTLMLLIIESPAIKIVFLGQECASKLKKHFLVTLKDLENLLHLSYLIRCSFSQQWFLDDDWLTWRWNHIIIIGFTRHTCFRSLSLKDLDSLMSSGEINLTDLNSPKPSERFFVKHICSLFLLLLVLERN